MTELIELHSGGLRLSIAPAIGGAVSAFERDGVPLFRATSAGALAAGEVRDFCCYPLVPFSNRIAGAELNFAGKTHVLRRYLPADPSAIHGNGWQRAWQVLSAGRSRASIDLVHDAKGARAREWPFSYRARQEFVLLAHGLKMTLAIANTGAKPFPCGLGWHPFFPRTADTELSFTANAMWETDAANLPTRSRRIKATHYFSVPRPLGETVLDNCFTGWRPAGLDPLARTPDAGRHLRQRALPLSRRVRSGGIRLLRRRAGESYDRRIQSRRVGRGRHRHPHARAGRDFFLYDARFVAAFHLMQFPLECVLDVKASLGEGPVWSVDEQVLYWVDINAPALNRFDPATGINTAWPMPQSIGSFALCASGGFVAAMRDGFWLVSRDGKPQRRVVDAPYDPAHHRFNDGRADPQGRFWAGSMNEKRDASTGCLYRLDPDLTLTAMIPGIMISNGLAWSPDARTMYHADTPTRTIHAWDYDSGTGTIGNRRIFAQFAGEKDRPDGAAVDREGCYWSAFYGAGKVVRLSPRGERLAEHPLAAMSPTMCAFGGPDLKTLFVTSARQRRDPEELERLPQSGGIFAMRVDVPGLPEPKFAGC